MSTRVDCPAKVRVSVESPLTHMCPFRKERDEGTVMVSWTADGKTFELHDLREFLDSFRDTEISHEELTELIREELSGWPGIWGVNVSARFTTAGMAVECVALPS